MTSGRAEIYPGYAVFAAMLATAGLPIYIHAPKFYVDEYGVSLGALGLVLFGLRLFDFVQDPILGWFSEAARAWRSASVLVASSVMAIAMILIFAVQPPIPPLIWFALTLTGLFTAFSFLTITFYAQGVRRAGSGGAAEHVRIAAWRETGAFLGICLAAAAPFLLLGLTARPFSFFAFGFALLAALAVIVMHREWRPGLATSSTGIGVVLADRLARRILLIAFLNAAPVAVTSTLFLFFVETRLEAPGWEGPLLILFFLSAAVAAPLWGRIARKYGAKPTLQGGMMLAIISFGFAAFLGPGDAFAFALVCLASGAALGADMTLLPALFATRMAVVAPAAGQAFGLWSFVSKFALAFAAVTLLPLLDAAGFQSGVGDNPPAALSALTLLYAVLPCVLKFFAIALLTATPLKES